MEKTPLIIITGPTAAGKTDLSIRLAKAIDGEIISADSMQVYRHMDIGSAKIRPEEMDGVPHHLIDVLDPAQEFMKMLRPFLFGKLLKFPPDGSVCRILSGGGPICLPLARGIKINVIKKSLDVKSGSPNQDGDPPS